MKSNQKKSIFSRFSKKILPIPEYKENDPRNYFTAAYDSKLHSMFERYFDKEDIEATFLQKDRIVLTDEILTRTSYIELDKDPFESFGNFEADSQKGIHRLLANKTFLDYYPLHDAIDDNLEKKKLKNDREFLLENWANFKCLFKGQPLEVIRRYFGEKIGFYFSWLEFYTKALVFPAIVGFFVFLYGVITVFSDIPTRDICEKERLGDRSMCPTCTESWCNNSTFKLIDRCNYARVSLFYYYFYNFTYKKLKLYIKKN